MLIISNFWSFRYHELWITTQLFLLYMTWRQLRLLLSIRLLSILSCSKNYFLYFAQSLMHIYCLQNSADELYLLFEQFCDHFHTTSKNSLYMNFISSHSNNVHAREQLRSLKNKASSSQVNFWHYYALENCSNILWMAHRAAFPCLKTSHLIVWSFPVCEEDAGLPAY